MTSLTWALRLFIFLLLAVFALQNTSLVELRLLPGEIWQVPLVVLLLVFFAAGAALGAMSLLSAIVRQRRELSRLKAAANKTQVPTIQAPPPLA